MSTYIDTNTTASMAAFNLNNNNNSLSNDIEQLSTGLRINNAGDDPAGYAVSENMSAQISGLTQATQNTNDADNLTKTAESSLSQVQNLLISMRQLAVQASNLGVNDSTDVQADQTQIASAIQSINQISTDTQFGTKYLLNGSSSSAATTTTGSAAYTGTTSAFSVLQQGAWSAGGSTANTLASGTISNIIASNGTPTTLVSGTPASYSSSDSYEGTIQIGTNVYHVGSSGNNVSLASLNTAIADSGYVATVNGTSGALTLTNTTDGATAATVDFSALNLFASATATTGGVAYSNGATGSGNTLNVLTTAGATGSAGTPASATSGPATLAGTGFTALDGSEVLSGTLSITLGSGSPVSVDLSAGVTTTGTGTGTLTGAIRTALGDNNWTATVASTGAITLTDGTNETIGTPVINADAVTIADGTGDTGTYTGSTSTDGVAGVAPTLNTRAVVTSSLNGVFATGDTFGGSLTVAGTTVNLTGTDNTLAALNSALNAANTGAGVGYTATQDSAGDLIFTQTQAAATAGVQTTLPVINLSGLGNYSGTVQTGGYTTVNVGEGPGASFTDNGNTVNSTYTQNAGNQSTFYFSNGLAFSIANMPATGSVSVNGTIAATPGTTTTGSNLEFQIGANEGQTVAIGLGSTAADQLGTSSTPLTYQDASGNTQTVLTNNVSDINVTTFKGAQDAIAVIDQAISQVSTYEANLGAFDDNVLQSQEQSLGAATTNLQAAQATISDADMASTVVDYTKNQILVQSATSALAFANQMPQSILKLLQ